MCQNKSRQQPDWNQILAVLLIAGALLAGLYFSLRYGGWSMEVDASRLAVSADGITASGRLAHPRSYNNGYGYGAQLAFVSLLAGLPVQEIQLGSGVWVFVTALAAWVAYREFLGRPPAAGLAVLLLLAQPDFLFYVLRGSHEKTTWAYALLMLFLLLRSYRHLRSPGRLAVYVCLFYLLFWAMAQANVYFASTFINAIVLSLGGGWLISRFITKGEKRVEERSRLLERLLLVSLSCLVMVFLFVNYTYRPALLYYEIFSSLLDRVSLLLLGGQPLEPPHSYSFFGSAWRSPAAYLLLTGLQWAIAALSLAAWISEARRLKELDRNRWLLWLLYAGFGTLLAFGVVVDFAGFLNTNLQLRLFTPFTLFSSPIAAQFIYRNLQRSGARLRRSALSAGAAFAAFALLAAALKVTNDPTFGNQWLFYTPAELGAARWMKEHLQEQTVWVDSWDHLAETFYFWDGYERDGSNRYEYGRVEPLPPYILHTQLTQLRTNRIGFSLPATAGHNFVYDNGVARLYHRRALTPYQR